jgi:outer membrane protein assembly factor BamB
LKRSWIAVAVVALAACSNGTTAAGSCAPASRAREVRKRWTLTPDDPPGAAAVDAHGAVVTLEHGHVVALDRSGDEVWRAGLGDAGLNWPVIDRDLVVVPTDGAGTDADGRCVAFDRATGTRRWTAQPGGGPVAATAVGGEFVVCAGEGGTLLAVDRSTGATRWKVDIAALVHGPVAVSPRSAVAVDAAADRVRIAARVKQHWSVLCLHLSTGADATCSWDFGPTQPPSAIVGRAGTAVVGATIAGATVVGAGSEPVPGIWLVDSATNRVRARIPTYDSFDPASVPAIVDGTAIVVDRSGGVTAVRVIDGTFRWRADLGGPVLDVAPSVAGAVVSVVDMVGAIHRFRLADGRPVDRPDDPGGAIAVVSDPAGTLRVTLRRGLAGAAVEGENLREGRSTRPLQCPAVPGHPTRTDARP